MRLFIGIEIPPDIRASIYKQSAQMALISPGKYVREDMYHITLAYIGNCSDEMYLLAADCMNSVASSETSVSIFPGAVSFFGKPEKAILHLNVLNGEQLQPICDSLRSKLTEVGLPFDSKPLVPHITLARNVHITEDLLKIDHTHAPFIADRLTLFNSCRVDDVLRYMPIGHAEFKGGK